MEINSFDSRFKEAAGVVFEILLEQTRQGGQLCLGVAVYTISNDDVALGPSGSVNALVKMAPQRFGEWSRQIHSSTAESHEAKGPYGLKIL